LSKETPALIDACFEKDWEDMKKQKYKSSTIEEVKEVMRKYYPILKENYKFEAGTATTGKVFGCSMGAINGFCEDLGLFDHTYKSADSDIAFSTINGASGGQKNPLVPKNTLVRF
jgi:hypothetical protein